MANSGWVQAVRKGLAASKPTTPDVPESTFVYYYETDTGILQMWNGSAWVEVVRLGTGASATVAAAGSTQADAAPIAAGLTQVTAANGTKGVVLPTPVPGMICYVKNTVASILKVYPPGTGVINALSASAAISMAASTAAAFIAFDTTTWYTFPLVPS
jgi:hypothetical protein